MRNPFAIPVALACLLLAQGPQPKPGRIGPADIYPDPVRTPRAANPQVTQRNIQDNICNRRCGTSTIRFLRRLLRMPKAIQTEQGLHIGRRNRSTPCDRLTKAW